MEVFFKVAKEPRHCGIVAAEAVTTSTGTMLSAKKEGKAVAAARQGAAERGGK